MYSCTQHDPNISAPITYQQDVSLNRNNIQRESIRTWGWRLTPCSEHIFMRRESFRTRNISSASACHTIQSRHRFLLHLPQHGNFIFLRSRWRELEFKWIGYVLSWGTHWSWIFKLRVGIPSAPTEELLDPEDHRIPLFVRSPLGKMINLKKDGLLTQKDKGNYFKFAGRNRDLYKRMAEEVNRQGVQKELLEKCNKRVSHKLHKRLIYYIDYVLCT